MPNKISKILNELTYSWYWDGPNKIIFEDEVWIQEINKVLEQEGLQYKWGYERGKATYYITQE